MYPNYTVILDATWSRTAIYVRTASYIHMYILTSLNSLAFIAPPGRIISKTPPTTYGT